MKPLNLVLTARLFLIGYVVPLASMLAALFVMWTILHGENADQNRALRVERRQSNLEARIIETRRLERARLVAVTDLRTCQRANQGNDILADLIRAIVANADTPAAKKRSEDFFAESLRRLAFVDCSKLPSQKLPTARTP